MEVLLGLFAGVGLAAACGFRVFVPLFIASVAGHADPDLLPIAEEFQWITSWPAMIALGTATILEIGSYYIPWLDNALDSIASPAAVVAGTLVSASVMPDMGPFLTWTTAAIMGGGSAGVVQAATVVVRGASTGTTGGLGNPAISTAELGGALGTGLLAVFIPILAIIIVVVVLVFCIRLLFRIFRRQREILDGSYEDLERRR